MLLTVLDFVSCDVAGGMTHWEVGKAEAMDPTLPVWERYSHAGASNIEMSAIALLVYTANQDKLGGVPIIKWLASQRNPNGGFSSTQVRGHNKYLVGRCSKISVADIYLKYNGIRLLMHLNHWDSKDGGKLCHKELVTFMFSYIA